MPVDRKDLFENRKVFGAILTLALPSALGQIILVIYNMADTLFVGLTGSDTLLSAVTVCTPAFMILSAVSNLFGIGASSVMARALGCGNREKAKQATAFAVWGCVAVTCLYCVGVLLLMDPFIDLLGGCDPQIHAPAQQYLIFAVLLGGLPTALNTLFSHLIRGTGHSTQASVGVALGGILNVALDPLFMFVILPEGSEALGAAAATAVSNLCAFFYYLILIARRREQLCIAVKPRKEMFENRIPREVFTVGIPACLMTLCENLSYAVLDHLMSLSGAAAQAGIGVAKKINMLAHCTVRGLSQGVLPLIAYNYASGNRKRMRQVFGKSMSIAVILAMMCTAVGMLFAGPLVNLFIHSDTGSDLLGMRFLRILSVGAPFSAFAYTVISFFQATGRGTRSLILALLRKGIVDIPLMYVLASLLPMYGIVWATPLADIICCFTAAALLTHFLKQHSGDP